MLGGDVMFRMENLLRSVEKVDWIGLRTLGDPTKIAGFRNSVKGIKT
jgi:hypothetical protein